MNVNDHTRESLIAFETRIKTLWEAGELPCLLHLCGGNEGQLLDIFNDVRPGDWIFSTHRNHYHALLAGIPVDTLEASILNGRSMFTYSREHNFFCSAVLAGTCCIATGVAFAIGPRSPEDNYNGRLGRPHVWCFIGDGGAEQGHFWEAINFVEAHDLPCTFIVEDNDRSVDTPRAPRRGNGVDPINRALATYKCVRRYEYTPTYPHAGAATPFQIQFKTEAIERLRAVVPVSK